MSNGLVQMAVATRAYGQLLQANPLRELCTGCHEGSKADESAFIAAIRAVAQLSSEADLSVGLFAAIRARDLGATAALLEAGADPSAGFGPSDTTSPLHLAVSTATEFGALSKQLLQNDGTIDPELSSWMVSLGGQVRWPEAPFVPVTGCGLGGFLTLQSAPDVRSSPRPRPGHVQYI